MLTTSPRARALRAVSQLTFTLGLAGCIQPPDASDPRPDPDGGPEPDGEAWADPDAALPDPGIEVDAIAVEGIDEGPASALDAGVDAEPLGDGDLPDAELAADATPPPCDVNDQENWSACCEAHGWDPDAGCLAWGPPVPPRVPGEVQ